MSCRDLIESNWVVGTKFVARKKKFARFDKTIPGLFVAITFGECSIEGWTLRAWFKPPNWVTGQPCIYSDVLISNNSATFDLEGTLLGTNGEWEVGVTLKGPDGQSRDSVDKIKYLVEETCEGSEVPPIPPEETCNTVDELIQALRDIIDEGNLAEIDWTATIEAGNEANDDWILTISAGDDAEQEWQVTIDTGNAANLVWLQTISDGNDLKDEIEALIANGDLIQKGAGFDDAKYPYLKDVTDHLEQKMYALDSRLVYAFVPSTRNVENLDYGIYVKNPLGNGDGTISGEDVDSMAGCFNEDGSFYCGEGYENLIKNYLDLNTWTFRQPNEIINITEKDENTQSVELIVGTGISQFGLRSPSVATGDGNTPYSSVLSIKNTSNVELFVALSFDEFELVSVGEEKIINLTYPDRIGSVSLMVGTKVIQAQGTVVTYDIKNNKSIVQSNAVVPFVKDTCPDGKLIIKENWDLNSHSFIIVHKGRAKNGNGSNFFKYDSVKYEINTPVSRQNDIKYAYISISSQGGFWEDGTTFNVVNTPSSAIDYLSFANVSVGWSSTYVNGIFIYKGNLTEQELLNELEKIKSNKFHIENTGTYEPIPGAKRRCNEYGQTKNFVYIESDSTNIQLVETNKVITTRTADRTVRIDTVDNLGVITGDGGVEDINGYLRLTANGRTKVEVEKYDD